MDQRERLNSHETAIRLAIDAKLREMQTSMPVQVAAIRLNGASRPMTADVQPLIRARLPITIPEQFIPTSGVTEDAQGNKWIQLPLLLDLPILFPGGGGFTLTFPISVGDEGLAIFSSRAIDNWWLAGGIQNPIEIRNHDLSDGFLFVGPRSQPNVLDAISTLGPTLRSDDGTLSIGMDGVTKRVNIIAPGGLYLNGVPVT